jgi:hypothetical protein
VEVGVAKSNGGNAPARAPEAVTLDVDGETIVYQRLTGKVHRLDRVGSVIWGCLDGQSGVDELVDDLAAAFSVEPGIVRKDVGTLLERLARNHLLADSPAPAPPAGPFLLTNPPSP